MEGRGKRLSVGQNEMGKEVIPINKSEGVLWLIKAYHAGFRDESSCNVLGVASQLGTGATMDLDAAREWMRRGEAIREAGRKRRQAMGAERF